MSLLLFSPYISGNKLKVSVAVLFNVTKNVMFLSCSVAFIQHGNSKLKTVRFPLGNCPGSEFYMPTFRNTLPFQRQVGVK